MGKHSGRLAKTRNRFDYGVVETFLIVVIISILFGTAWFVHRSTDATTATLHNTTKAAQSSVSASTPKVTSFAECQQAAGSVTQQTYPETCVTKEGKAFTDTSTRGSSQGYLIIQEWGVKLALADADKMAYILSTDSSGLQTASLYLTSTVTAIKDCQDLDVGVVRDLPHDSISDDRQTVAGHTYAFRGSPNSCDEGGGSTNGPINQLRNKIVENELPTAKVASIN